MYDILQVFNDRINMLKSGRKLVLNHSVYGIFIIAMNPQENRIYVEQEIAAYPNWTVIPPQFNEDKILSLLFWDCGEWYELKGEKSKNTPASVWENFKKRYELEKL